jgi:hypothetical protein
MKKTIKATANENCTNLNQMQATATLRKGLLTILVAVTALSACHKDKEQSPQEKEIAQLRTTVAPFKLKAAGVEAGYDQDVTGYRTQMGYHYLNAELLDNKFELNKPELLLYAPYGADSMKLVAVEYATPIEDLNNPPAKPEGFSGSEDVWEINTEFKLWTLHVWVGLDNPHGLFASHNPLLP